MYNLISETFETKWELIKLYKNLHRSIFVCFAIDYTHRIIITFNLNYVIKTVICINTSASVKTLICINTSASATLYGSDRQSEWAFEKSFFCTMGASLSYSNTISSVIIEFYSAE